MVMLDLDKDGIQDLIIVCIYRYLMLIVRVLISVGVVVIL